MDWKYSSLVQGILFEDAIYIHCCTQINFKKWKMNWKILNHAQKQGLSAILFLTLSKDLFA